MLVGGNGGVGLVFEADNTAEVGLVCGSQLRHLICLRVFRPRNVLDVEGIVEANKGKCYVLVSPHCVLLGVEFSRDLSDDKLGVAEHSNVADTNIPD